MRMQPTFEHHQTVKLTGTMGAIWASWSGAMTMRLLEHNFDRVEHSPAHPGYHGLKESNFTIDGGFCFFRASPTLTEPWSDEQTHNFIVSRVTSTRST